MRPVVVEPELPRAAIDALLRAGVDEVARMHRRAEALIATGRYDEARAVYLRPNLTIEGGYAWLWHLVHDQAARLLRLGVALLDAEAQARRPRPIPPAPSLPAPEPRTLRLPVFIAAP